jgi:lysophospholipid acyltransferase (LPLAT)-like uncharacterized protein
MLKFKHKFFIGLINLISLSWRIRIKGQFPEKPAIILFWHGKMLPVWKAFSKYSPTGVVSKSRDGEILSGLLKKWNFSLIRGSSSTDGKIVLNKIIEAAGGNFILMTPDGPRGPSGIMKAGGVVSAQRSGVSLYLCGVKISKKYEFKKSWDNFNLPMPFSSIILNFSDCKIVDKSADRNEINKLIDIYTNELNILDNE